MTGSGRTLGAVTGGFGLKLLDLLHQLRTQPALPDALQAAGIAADPGVDLRAGGGTRPGQGARQRVRLRRGDPAGVERVQGAGQVLHQAFRRGEGEGSGGRGPPARQGDLVGGAVTLLIGGKVATAIILADPLLGDDLPGRFDRSEGGPQMVQPAEHGERLLRGVRSSVGERVAHRRRAGERSERHSEDLCDQPTRLRGSRQGGQALHSLEQGVTAARPRAPRSASRCGRRLLGAIPVRWRRHISSVGAFDRATRDRWRPVDDAVVWRKGCWLSDPAASARP